VASTHGKVASRACPHIPISEQNSHAHLLLVLDHKANHCLQAIHHQRDNVVMGLADMQYLLSNDPCSILLKTVYL